MALDIAAGILIAGMISGIFSLGVWMFAEGLDADSRGLRVGGAILAIVAFGLALILIVDRVVGGAFSAIAVFLTS
jgi:hypothetical protein